jgi:restriction endonuclease S subunit
LSFLQSYLEKHARVTTVPILNKTNFQNLKISRPSNEIQSEIAKKLDTIIRKIEYETDVKKALEKLFDSLLHHLMTGKVRVNTLIPCPSPSEGEGSRSLSPEGERPGEGVS